METTCALGGLTIKTYREQIDFNNEKLSDVQHKISSIIDSGSMFVDPMARKRYAGLRDKRARLTEENSKLLKDWRGNLND